MIKKITHSLLGMALLAGVASSTFAGSTAITMNPSVIFQGVCFISMGDINFGALKAGSTNQQAGNNLSVLCTPTTTYKFQVLYSSSDYSAGQSHMTGAKSGDKINFGVLKPDSSSYFSGNSLSSDYVSGTGNGFIQSYPINANISTVPYVTPDTYSDTITVSLSY